MGYIKTDLLTLPFDSTVQVRMKQFMSTGDWMAARTFWRTYPLPLDPESEDYKLAVAQREVDSAKHIMSRVILDWNLTDADDLPMPVSPESLDELARDDFVFLEEKATAVMSGRPVEAEAPFGKRSGKRSRATTSKRRAS